MDETSGQPAGQGDSGTVKVELQRSFVGIGDQWDIIDLDRSDPRTQQLLDLEHAVEVTEADLVPDPTNPDGGFASAHRVGVAHLQEKAQPAQAADLSAPTGGPAAGPAPVADPGQYVPATDTAEQAPDPDPDTNDPAQHAADE